MIILAFLQNQWFENPELTRRMYAEHPERRNRYIQAFLFMGCLSGRRLKEALGQDLCGQIIWEEASPQIAGHSAAAFPPDPKHIAQAIENFKPDIILAFGRIASDGLEEAIRKLSNVGDNFVNGWPEHVPFTIIKGPHPASRGLELPAQLRKVKQELDGVMSGSSG